MSASTIARWNAINMQRTDPPANQKRPRSDNGDDDDDDISLVSRSPSPPPTTGGEARTGSEWYDDHVKGAIREVITIETKLKPTNVGFALLKKMGWSEGKGLGVTGEGRPDPIPFSVKTDSTGLGKIDLDLEVIESTVASRRELDSERQIKETDEQRAKREAQVAQREAIATEVSATLRPFYCDVCDKQYKNVAQYDEHVRGYAHTHKIRFKEMQASQRSKDDNSKRKEKERKREEKEMRKIAAAAGVKLPSVKTSIPIAASPLPSTTAEPQKAGGWATVSSPITTGGWAAVTSALPLSSSTSGNKWAPVKVGEPSKAVGWASVPRNTSMDAEVYDSTPSKPDSSSTPGQAANLFVSGGWTQLATTTSSAIPSGFGPQSDLVSSRGTWATVSPSPAPTSRDGSVLPTLNPASPPQPSDPPPPPPPQQEFNGIHVVAPSKSTLQSQGYQGERFRDYDDPRRQTSYSNYRHSSDMERDQDDGQGYRGDYDDRKPRQDQSRHEDDRRDGRFQDRGRRGGWR